MPEVSPSEVELKLLNSTAAVAYWRRPSQPDLNGELTGFKIEIFSNNSLVTNFTLEPSATSLLLSNLTKSVIYTVRLAAFNRAGMGPFSEPVSLKVEPSLLYQPQLPHPSLAFPPEPPPPSSVGRIVKETWFVSTIGFLAILLILTLVGCIVFKRRHCKDKSFGHYTGRFWTKSGFNCKVFIAVPVCKVEDGSGRNFLESDTLWINPKACGVSHSQQGTEKG